jgi:ankyrin repeat protein
VIDVLLNGGANLERASNNGHTALIHAVYGNEPAAVQQLLKRGANYTKVDDEGQTALSIALEKQPWAESIVKLLEDAGARREPRDKTDTASKSTVDSPVEQDEDSINSSPPGQDGDKEHRDLGGTSDVNKV